MWIVDRKVNYIVHWIRIYPGIELYINVHGSCCGKVDNTMRNYTMKHSVVDKYCRENKIALSAG